MNLKEQLLKGPITTVHGLKLESRGMQWVMSGGFYGEHVLYKGATSDARLKAHWEGYQETDAKMRGVAQ